MRGSPPSAVTQPEPDRGAAGAALARPPGRVVARTGAELAALSERFYGRMFAGTVAFVGVAALAALAVLPLRGERPPGGVLGLPVVLAAILVPAAPLAARRAPALGRLLRRHRAAEAAVVALAALLVTYPFRTELWWPSCAVLMALGVLGSPLRALGHAAAVVGIALGSHLVAGDLGELAAVTVVGMVIGYPLWTVGVAVSSDLLAAHLLRLAAPGAPPPDPPPRGVAWTPPAPSGEPAPAPAAAPPRALPAPRGRPTPGRLTPRQLQVVALLSDGMRYAEVAECLSISPRQVQRHVAQATERLGVANVYELVALAVAEGLVPR